MTAMDKSIPHLTYPGSLPICHHRKKIVGAIRRHNVLILSGETGSGKTTQIPKMCVEAGRGRRGLIGCTQPRRIAALTVAERVGEELGLPEAVGCRIRFHDSGSRKNLIRVMTDGILLAEAQGSPDLRAYDTIIIDEAHERSLNIDVLLGMMCRLIERRRDLKLIITSATLDMEKFSRHFGDAPIIEVSGRMYPVDIRYCPPGDGDAEKSLGERVVEAVNSILNESRSGDILVFQPTEQDIRETVKIVHKQHGERLNVVPLFARLPASEQSRAFVLGGRRKLVVATNVAETSLTIPGIRYVVDTGLARISQYNPSTRIHGLPVTPISRSSANQRAGRCGRTENGVCYRLYSEDDFHTRAEYTLPEIQRVNLAEVILRLLDIGITAIESFPFLDPPPAAGISDGLGTLRETGALESAKSRLLTPKGKLMARLPLDPRLACMLIRAEQESALGDVLPIASALSVQDPREVPPDKAGLAQAAHTAFRCEQSDFITLLNIWDGFRSKSGGGSYSGRLKHYCRENFLSFRRMREWVDIHRQLALVMEEEGFKLHRKRTEAWVDKKGEFTQRYGAIHRAVLSGLLSNIARLEKDACYQASRGRRAYIHPGSALRKNPCEWIVAAQLVRTSRLFVRTAAAIDPLWLEELGAHLVTRRWIRPHWSAKACAVMAEEQVRLFGILIAEGRMVPYGPIQPGEARAIFIKSFLIDSADSHTGDYAFLRYNRRLLKRLEGMEDKLRRRDLLVGEDAMSQFYCEKLPPQVLDISTLNHALKADRNLEIMLQMSEDDLLTGMDVRRELELFPDEVGVSGQTWRLSYKFDPVSRHDGVTLNIPAGQLEEIRHGDTDWMVPGLLREKVEAMMRSLPKPQRRRLIPIAETAKKALKEMKREGSLPYALSAWLYSELNLDIPPDSWNMAALPDYLKVRLSLLDDTGVEAAAGFDQAALRQPSGSDCLRAASRGPAARYRKEHEREGFLRWPMEDIPESVDIGGGAVLWPALQDNGDSVSLRYFDLKTEARASQLGGQQRLAIFHWEREITSFRREFRLYGRAKIAADQTGGAEAMEDSLWFRVIADVFAAEIIRTVNDWQVALTEGGRRLYSTARDYFAMLTAILDAFSKTSHQLETLINEGLQTPFLKGCATDAEALLHRNFICSDPLRFWQAMPRWLHSLAIRARRGVENPAREQHFQEHWKPLNHRLEEMLSGLSIMATKEKRSAVKEAEFMLQELRLTLTAGSEMRTVKNISAAKVRKFLDEIERML